MSSCPSCGKKLSVFNLGQTCPHCGKNMRFYGFDEKFYSDAKKAELSLANVHVKLRRFKAALIGGKLPIIRLCVMILPLASLLIPSSTAHISLPFFDVDMMISLLGLFGAYSDKYLFLIPGFADGTVDGVAFTALFRLLIAFAACALFAVLIFLLSILCFINIKKMSAVLCTVSVLGFASCGAVAVFAKLFNESAKASEGIVLSASLSFGYIIAAVMFIVVFAVNLLIIKKGISVEYDEGMLERVEIYKKVKNGEINIDDLPQPIVETAETRAIDEEILNQQKLYREIENERRAQSSEA